MLWLDYASSNSIITSRKSIVADIIKFPKARLRVGRKYRQEEIDRINDLLRLCDEDMQTVLEQIDQLQVELSALTAEYEALLKRLKELTDIEGGMHDK
jgi:archaellum component FlaC